MANGGIVVRIFQLIAPFLVFLLSFSQPHAQTMSKLAILTGAPTGTYFRFGKDINQIIGHACGAPVEVRESAGSLDNLKRLRKEPFVQLAIVQHDVLSFIKVFKNDDKELLDWVDKYKYVMSLYPEEIHLVTRKNSGIEKIDDLRGKRVGIGTTDSGTRLTATMLMNLLELSIQPVEISPDAALEKMLSPEADIDAFLAVVGKPSTLLSAKDPRFSNLRLVPITDERAFTLYQKAEIKREDYDWVETPVETISVRAALISFDFRGEQCDNVAMMARQISDNLEDLQRFGHRKWGEVKLEAPVPGWTRYDCVTERIRLPLKAAGATPKCEFSRTVEAPPARQDQQGCPCNKFSGAEKIICELSKGRCPSN